MISEKQFEANRRNAELSTGPKTEEGRRRSSLNARRHGLTGQVSAMTEEDRAAHDEFSASMLKDMTPEGAVETQLAQRIATDNWRLNRISAVEDNIFALGFTEHAEEVEADHPEIHAALTAAKVFVAEAKSFQLLTLYEQRLNRAVQKNLAMLQQIQAKRKAEREAAISQAKMLCQLDDRKAKPHEAAVSTPYAVNGFVFSNDEIRAAINFEGRLQRAKHLNFRHDKFQKERAKAA